MPEDKESVNPYKALKHIEKFIDKDRLILFKEVFSTKNEWFKEQPEDTTAKELYEVLVKYETRSNK